ncbi:MAG: TetR-like C-terminal domain-containing protein [Pseudoclavibacter sp.]
MKMIPLEDPPKTVGRPRSATARQAIITAAIDLLASGGPATATISAIAARAGVGKSTIYRWWPGRGALLIEALARGTVDTLAVPTGTTTRAALLMHLRGLIAVLADERLGALIAALTAEAQETPATAEAFRETWLRPRREVAIAILRAGIERGDLRSDLDVGLGVDQLFAPLYHRLLYRYAPIDADIAETAVDLFLRGTGTGERAGEDRRP